MAKEANDLVVEEVIQLNEEPRIEYPVQEPMVAEAIENNSVIKDVTLEISILDDPAIDFMIQYPSGIPGGC